MARLSSVFSFTGKLGDVSAYKMRGVDFIVVRRPGGPSGERIKTDPALRRTRENNNEFKGRAKASKWARRALGLQTALADHNLAGPLTAAFMPIQKMDEETARGNRHILLSRNPQLLEGFSLNRKTLFESIVRSPLSYSLSRGELSAHIGIPDLLPGINFFAQNNYPMFRIQAVLGTVPDLFNGPNGYNPSSGEYKENDVVTVSTPWYPCMKGCGAVSLDLSYKQARPDESFSLMLSAGICFGTMREATSVQQVPHTGAAKVLATA